MEIWQSASEPRPQYVSPPAPPLLRNAFECLHIII